MALPACLRTRQAMAGSKSAALQIRPENIVCKLQPRPYYMDVDMEESCRNLPYSAAVSACILQRLPAWCRVVHPALQVFWAHRQFGGLKRAMKASGKILCLVTAAAPVLKPRGQESAVAAAGRCAGQPGHPGHPPAAECGGHRAEGPQGQSDGSGAPCAAHHRAGEPFSVAHALEVWQQALLEERLHCQDCSRRPTRPT